MKKSKVVILGYCFSVTKSCPILWLQELQQARLPCPSLSPWNCSNSRPLNQSCIPADSSSVAPFSSFLSIFPRIRVFSNESALHIRWSLSYSISPFNEYSGLIFFMIDSFDLFALQETLKSLFQHHSSKASILFFCDFLWSNSHICTWLLDRP